jgi:DNA-binding transcriptional ArsR family regulator
MSVLVMLLLATYNRESGGNERKVVEMAKRTELTEWARGFALLADPTRLGILKILSAGPKNVTALCTSLGLKQPTISHHLGLLRMGRLVVGTRQGKSVVYVTDASSMKELAAAITKLTPGR